MNHGIITHFNEEKNYGFIKDITGENFYFHISGFAAAVRPERWMKVKFESVPDAKGKSYDKAVEILPE